MVITILILFIVMILHNPDQHDNYEKHRPFLPIEQHDDEGR